MKSERFNNTIVLRADPGEDLCEVILEVCARENVKLASVSGIGAAREVMCGVFDPVSKEYHSRTFSGVYEITSLAGNVSTMNGKLYEHLHITFADEDYQVHGGHLNKCIISATAEVVLQVIEGEVDRFASEEIGLNLFQLD